MSRNLFNDSFVSGNLHAALQEDQRSGHLRWCDLLLALPGTAARSQNDFKPYMFSYSVLMLFTGNLAERSHIGGFILGGHVGHEGALGRS